ncbi:unnamed protein product [Parnassius mnemosyne]|uniref:Cadherin domain-containing protein n=1 Tax=Parnassius mnemosyne TaxID=213953 RepID=A0AAV1MAV7_9NEOP
MHVTEVSEPYVLRVRASDRSGHYGDAQLALYVGDVSANDGVPRFLRPAASDRLHVTEVSEPYVLRVRASDRSGHYGDAQLALYVGDVSANDGVPRFLRPAASDRLHVTEVSEPYVLRVRASDRSGHYGDAQLALYVGDVSANDGVPRFLRPAASDRLHVTEVSEPYVLRVRASDRSGHYGDAQLALYVGDVSANDGVPRFLRPAASDRLHVTEVSEPYVLRVRASDRSGHYGDAQLALYVGDVSANDGVPRFLRPAASDRLHVTEVSEPYVLRVRASDRSGHYGDAQLALYVGDVSANDGVPRFLRPAASDRLHVTEVSEPYVLRVRASDRSGHYGDAQLALYVGDVSANDGVPRFLRPAASDRLHVTEVSEPYVLRVRASDRSGHYGDAQLALYVGDVSANDGVPRFLRPAASDRLHVTEVSEPYVLRVRASDRSGHYGDAQLALYVGDVSANDGVPRFLRPAASDRLHVTEVSEPYVLRVRASDRSGHYGDAQLALYVGDVSANDGVPRFLRPAASDRLHVTEVSEPYVLRVRASDRSGHYGDAQLALYVGDVSANDGVPRFLRPAASDRLHVTEVSEPYVLRVRASDRSGHYGDAQLALYVGDVSANDGVPRFLRPAASDRLHVTEVSEPYVLRVRASDRSGHYGDAQLALYVGDVSANDGVPRFLRPAASDRLHVTEVSEPYVLRVRASDRSGHYGDAQLALYVGDVSANDGVPRFLRPAASDRLHVTEVSEPYVLRVRASDRSGHYGDAQLALYVGDVSANDGVPRFLRPAASDRLHVTEVSEPYVLRVRASDRSGHYGDAQLALYVGDVSANDGVPRFLRPAASDRLHVTEVSEPYVLRVRASDRSGHYGDAQLALYVGDVSANDGVPRFLRPAASDRLHVTEVSEPYVLRVRASDRSGHYGDAQLALYVGDVSANDGVPRFLRPAASDRLHVTEVSEPYVLRVRASDRSGHYGDAQLALYVGDVSANDGVPRFLRPAASDRLHVTEVSEPYVLRVRASDRSGHYGDAQLALYVGDVSANDGVPRFLRPAASDRLHVTEVSEPYVLRVRASDRSGHYGDAQLALYVGDVSANDGVPRFLRPAASDRLHVTEVSEPYVLRVRASDRSGHYGDAQLALYVGDVSANDGVPRFLRPAASDRLHVTEVSEPYVLRVRASDRSGHYGDAQLALYVGDVSANDGVPRFLRPAASDRLHVTEVSEPYVLRVRASDRSGHYGDAQLALYVGDVSANDGVPRFLRPAASDRLHVTEVSEPYVLRVRASDRSGHYGDAQLALYVGDVSANDGVPRFLRPAASDRLHVTEVSEPYVLRVRASDRSGHYGDAQLALYVGDVSANDGVPRFLRPAASDRLHVTEVSEPYVLRVRASDRSGHYGDAQLALYVGDVSANDGVPRFLRPAASDRLHVTEVSEPYVLRVRASDRSGHYGDAQLALYVGDVSANDGVPRFLRPAASDRLHVTEVSEPYVLRVRASDRSGHYGDAQLALYVGDVSANDGVPRFLRPAASDRLHVTEVSEPYVLRVRASDRSGHYGDAQLALYVGDVSANDGVPRFLRPAASDRLHVTEVSEPYVLRVRASDRSGHYGDAQLALYVGDVSANDGVPRFLRPAASDRLHVTEVSEPYVLRVRASDRSGHYGDAQLALYVGDVSANDGVPRFLRPAASDRLHVTEVSEPYVLRVRASDRSGHYGDAQLALYVGDVSANDGVPRFLRPAASDRLHVTEVSEPYVLRVRASDRSGHYGDAQLALYVGDVSANDGVPRFLRPAASDRLHVTEVSEPYVLRVRASDRSGHYGDAQLALYVGDVSANDGVPRFLRPAASDRLHVTEVSEPYVLRVRASDRSGHYGDAQLALYVGHVSANDGVPRFLRPAASDRLHVTEVSEPYVLRVRASDRSGHYGDAQLALYVGDVSANDGVPRFLRPAASDRLHVTEVSEPYVLRVRASDRSGHYGDAQLALYVGDVSANDGVPRFLRPAASDRLHVTENATIGTVVFQVVASDPDDPTQPSGQLLYSIQEGNADAKAFAIDPQTGVITTRQSLDRERQGAYTLVVCATDRGAPPQQATRVVSIALDDVDDHKPHFARALDDPPILMTTKEEVPIGTVIGKLEAVDEDIGENAAIDYAITAGNEFALVKLERTNDSKALIIAAARLDRESVSRLLLTIKCFKYDTTPKLNKSYNRLDPSEIQVLVKILDIDDHLPDFGSQNLTVGIRLNVPVDTVVATVRAIDKDPDALPIDYKIVNMSFESPIKSKSLLLLNNLTDVMVLDNVTGELKIMKNLLHYADGIFRLVIRANNSQEADRYSDLMVEVVVVRERDLLRLALGGRARLGELRARLAALLQGQNLRLQLHDAPHSAFYDTAGPCFQFRKMDTGEALTPKAMKATIRKLDTEFQQILEEFEVRNITGCGATRVKHTPAQHALLGLAGALPLAALVATLVLCCMHSSAKRRARSGLLSAREAASHVSAPSRLYAEPLYST